MVAWSTCAGVGDVRVERHDSDFAAIKVERVKPVDKTSPNLRLSDDRIDLMTASFSLSNAQAIGGAWGIPLLPPTPFDERYGQW